MNRFILVVDDATVAVQNAITSWAKEGQRLGFWHHFSDMWLLSDATGKWSVGSIRDAVKALAPNHLAMVVRIDDNHDWAGYGETEKFRWVYEHWSEVQIPAEKLRNALTKK